MTGVLAESLLALTGQESVEAQAGAFAIAEAIQVFIAVNTKKKGRR